MIGGLGVWELLIILVILLLIFGPGRLGDLGSSLGKGIKGFKKEINDPDEIDVTPSKQEDTKQIKDSELETTRENSARKEKINR